MDHQEITAKLREVHAELAAAEDVDEETLALLGEVTADLQKLSRRGKSRASQEDVDSVAGRMQDLLTRFEADHPRLTSVLQQVLDALANLGI